MALTLNDPNDPRLRQVVVADLVTIDEIAAMAGVQRDTVDGWRTRDSKGRREASPMPTPLLPKQGQITRTPLWDRNAVRDWLNATGRLRPGGLRSVVPAP